MHPFLFYFFICANLCASVSYLPMMIAELNEPYSPDLIVLDGVEAFTDGGPDKGTRVRSEVMLAGTDRVALVPRCRGGSHFAASWHHP